MSTVLTAVAPILFAAARRVPRELTGFLGACDRSFNDQGVAKGDVVKVAVSPVMTAATVTPAMTWTAGTDRTIASKSLTLDQFKETSFNLTAEQERSLANGGTADDVLAQSVQQGIRVLVNTIESYIWGVADANFSRGYGAATTTPFGTAANLTDTAAMRKILADNGAPMDDCALIMDTTAGANIRGVQTTLFKANEAGSDDLLRQGVLGRIHGFDLRESNAVTTHTAGSGTSYVVNGTHAAGATSLIIKTGSGTVLAGDVISVASAGGTFKYGVVTGVSAAGTVVIQEPGLKVAAADSDVVAITATHTANFAMHRSAICAVVRPALQPPGAAVEQMIVSDPQTGLSFLMLRVPGNAMSSWYMRVVYDAFAPNPYALGKLIG